MTNCITRARMGARMFAGLGVCSRGCGLGYGNVTGCYRERKKYLASARVREGHPTPLPIAMQSRHIFSIFKVIHTGYFANH
jgi:hypothetical protein